MYTFKVVRLDVNTATEEELMTLTGITRNIAHTIIEHRNVIGAFKKVEDLALVTGVGAAKLQTIKPEICIGKKVPRYFFFACLFHVRYIIYVFVSSMQFNSVYNYWESFHQ